MLIKIKIYSKVNRYILYYIGIDARLSLSVCIRIVVENAGKREKRNKKWN